MSDDPKLKVVYPEAEPPAEPIPKPEKTFSLDKFKSKNPNATPNVETLPTVLQHGTFARPKTSCGFTPTKKNTGRPNCASCMCRSLARSAIFCT